MARSSAQRDAPCSTPGELPVAVALCPQASRHVYMMLLRI